eukprot:TRINITY_DN40369_c0_g1_i1.p1 TRINITY_DN40369_c0_g1~~TRINITY_DN40369_c0_g1_i1.p1  ORF type:complete len:460 (+),score=45.31 TRINITY_DN40369_c0_g1_i1:1128-2507(+)
MVGDQLFPFIIHPVTYALVTTEERKLVQLGCEEYVCAPVHDLCDMIRREMHLGFTILYLRKIYQAQAGFGQLRTLVLFEVDTDSTDLQLPYGLVWTPKHEATRITGQPTSPLISEFLLEYSKRGVRAKEERLYPYSKSGWFKRAREWIFSNLGRYEEEKVMTVSQVTLNTQGSVLCATTRTNCKYFMKAVPPNGINEEVVVSCAIAMVFPDVFWKPLAVDYVRRWMLMRDYGIPLGHGDCLMSSEMGSQRMRKILLEWSLLQKRAIEKKGALVRLGVPVWDESLVLQEVQKMMGDPVWYDMQKTGMNEDELLRFGNESEYKESYAAYVKRLFMRLNGFDVPFSLVHGDLNPVNVIIQENQACLFFDFSLTCISVPFIDAIRFISLCGGRKDDLDFYLEQWTEFESMDRLRKLLDVVDDLDEVLSLLILYQSYLTSEDVLKDSTRQELSFSVCHTFSKYV